MAMSQSQYEPGSFAKIKNLSKSSYFLAKGYKKTSPLIVCPCELENKRLEVIEHFENDSVLLRFKDLLTIVFSADLIHVESED